MCVHPSQMIQYVLGPQMVYNVMQKNHYRYTGNSMINQIGSSWDLIQTQTNTEFIHNKKWISFE